MTQSIFQIDVQSKIAEMNDILVRLNSDRVGFASDVKPTDDELINAGKLHLELGEEYERYIGTLKSKRQRKYFCKQEREFIENFIYPTWEMLISKEKELDKEKTRDMAIKKLFEELLLVPSWNRFFCYVNLFHKKGKEEFDFTKKLLVV
jgi:hypothetical protein